MRILCFVGNYLPGYKAGGALRTVANIVTHFGGEFEFFLVTRDRDLGDDCSYPGVKLNQWVRQGSANVYYAEGGAIGFSQLAVLARDASPDLIYLNSFFDFDFSIKVILAWRLGMLGRRRLLLAPRGEFFEGAIGLKKRKKEFFIGLVKVLRLYRGVRWHASNKEEAQTINRVMGVDLRQVAVAVDLPSKLEQGDYLKTEPVSIGNKTLRIVFLSRVSPKKNLKFLLQVLTKVNVEVTLDIYGPLEDLGYWEECKVLMGLLPGSATATYRGMVAPEDVPSTFARYDLFFFPTMGENYGHVIAEALAVGTPVLLSDQTPWLDMERSSLGWDFSLKCPEKFIDAIETFSRTSPEFRMARRLDIRRKMADRFSDPAVLDATRLLFKNLMG